MAPGQSEVLEMEAPSPEPGEALVKIQAVTTCPQWDLHLKHNEPMFLGHHFHYPYPPGQPGHEATGVVTALGAGVHELAEGDRVSVWRDPGAGTPGCYAQFVARRVEDLIKVPAHLPPVATAPVELAMCVGAAFIMLREMNAIAGKIFGITGLGPAGLIALQMARAEGAAEIIGFDPSPARRNGALHLGLDRAIDPGDSAEIPARPARLAIECGIDCVGSKKSVEFMMDRVADILALFGVQREEYTFAPRHYAGLRLCGYKGHSRAAAEYAVSLMAEGQLNLQSLTTQSLPLERYDEGIALLEAQQAIKICFLPWEGEGV